MDLNWVFGREWKRGLHGPAFISLQAPQAGLCFFDRDPIALLQK
jgi:hypothetical protein